MYKSYYAMWSVAACKRRKDIKNRSMNENFQYLGEIIIGDERTWNFANSFVTLKGLNIRVPDL
jgi:hypothetical protein